MSRPHRTSPPAHRRRRRIPETALAILIVILLALFLMGRMRGSFSSGHHWIVVAK